MRPTNWPPLLFSLLVTLGACVSEPLQAPRPGEALASLPSASESARFGSEFWLEEARQGTSVWRRGLAFCHRHLERDLPNCHTLFLVEAVHALEQDGYRITTTPDNATTEARHGR